MHGAFPLCSSVSRRLRPYVCVYNNLYWHNPWLYDWRRDLKITEVGNTASSKLSLWVSLHPLPLFLRGSLSVQRQPNKSLSLLHDHFPPKTSSFRFAQTSISFCRGRACHARGRTRALRWREGVAGLISEVEESNLLHLASEKTRHQAIFPQPDFSEAVMESVPVFSLARPPPASKDKLRHLVCSADCWAGHRLSAAPQQAAARHRGRRKGQERLPPTRPTYSTTTSQRKKKWNKTSL